MRHRANFALLILPEYDCVIERAYGALKDGRRCVVLDQKLPTGPAARLVPLLNLLSRPLDYSGTLGDRRPWESIGRHAGNVRVEELYFGFVCLAVGEKNAAGAQRRQGTVEASRPPNPYQPSSCQEPRSFPSGGGPKPA